MNFKNSVVHILYKIEHKFKIYTVLDNIFNFLLMVGIRIYTRRNKMNRITEQVYQGNLENAIEVAKGNDGFGAIVFLAQSNHKELENSNVPVIHIPTKDEQ